MHGFLSQAASRPCFEPVRGGLTPLHFESQRKQSSLLPPPPIKELSEADRFLLHAWIPLAGGKPSLLRAGSRRSNAASLRIPTEAKQFASSSSDKGVIGG